MFSRVIGAIAALIAATVLPACMGGATTAQAPLDPEPAAAAEPEWVQGADAAGGEESHAADMLADAEELIVPVAPPSWTGAFSETSVVLASTIRVEGPAGLRDHIVASSDDVYERSLETTPDGLVQIIRRTSDETREIRVQIDAWSLAAYDRVVIVERFDDGPIRIIASGEALWRNTNGSLLQGNRLEFSGELGDDAPFAPPSSAGPDDANNDANGTWSEDQSGAAQAAEGDSSVD